MTPFRIFIGFDDRQPIAYNVAQMSIALRSSKPVAITPLIYETLPVKRTGLTKFTYTRYAVPYLCNYEGHALFVDADVLCMGDVAELPWDSDHAVSVVPHTYVEKDGKPFSVHFERTSVMLFNCGKCQKLTLEEIESGKPQMLSWAPSVGTLPPEWNHLVGYDTPKPTKLAHFTQGIPCFEETKGDEFAAEWMKTLEKACSTVSWEEIMGPSVHAQWKKHA